MVVCGCIIHILYVCCGACLCLILSVICTALGEQERINASCNNIKVSTYRSLLFLV